MKKKPWIILTVIIFICVAAVYAYQHYWHGKIEITNDELNFKGFLMLQNSLEKIENDSLLLIEGGLPDDWKTADRMYIISPEVKMGIWNFFLYHVGNNENLGPENLQFSGLFWNRQPPKKTEMYGKFFGTLEIKSQYGYISLCANSDSPEKCVQEIQKAVEYINGLCE